MAGRAWSDAENDLIVADYFAMLRKDYAGEPYSKTQHRRELLPLLDGRSEASIEYKRRNISAVLRALGEDWLPGYLPAPNIQATLEDAVMRWLAANPQWFTRQPLQRGSSARLDEPGTIWIGPAPTLSNQPPPKEWEET